MIALREAVARAMCGNGCSFPSCTDGDLVAVACECIGEQADAAIRAVLAHLKEHQAELVKAAVRAEFDHYYAPKKPTELTWIGTPPMVIAKMLRAILEQAERELQIRDSQPDDHAHGAAPEEQG